MGAAMPFELATGEYFTGRIEDEDGIEEIVVWRGSRAAAVRITLAEAKQRGCAWLIALEQERPGEFASERVAEWSSRRNGGELPPLDRAQCKQLLPNLNTVRE